MHGTEELLLLPKGIKPNEKSFSYHGSSTHTYNVLPVHKSTVCRVSWTWGSIHHVRLTCPWASNISEFQFLVFKMEPIFTYLTGHHTGLQTNAHAAFGFRLTCENHSGILAIAINVKSRKAQPLPTRQCCVSGPAVNSFPWRNPPWMRQEQIKIGLQLHNNDGSTVS